MAYCGAKPKSRIFRPNYSTKSLTLKFYAKHDNAKIPESELKQYNYFANEVEKRLIYDIRDQYYAPVTESQNYGWLERSADKYRGLDSEILWHPLLKDEIMTILKKIAFERAQLKN